MFHFALLALSVFLVYEIGRASLPDRVPGIVHALGLPVIALLLNRYASEEILMAVAAASVAAVIDRIIVGSSRTISRVR
ncbi:hypothetical protein [Terracoccus sp. 273MFTsu3.1]|uniref:hypothetical protein n=1 Tax=Terracoccus sp. 273MFTsu3.1 TaxID=1172188 RepID=UPI000375A747|nr:hypothetical protein [Terracoccus sp. 273MFTsu3.1]